MLWQQLLRADHPSLKRTHPTPSSLSATPPRWKKANRSAAPFLLPGVGHVICLKSLVFVKIRCGTNGSQDSGWFFRPSSWRGVAGFVFFDTLDRTHNTDTLITTSTAKLHKPHTNNIPKRTAIHSIHNSSGEERVRGHRGVVVRGCPAHAWRGQHAPVFPFKAKGARLGFNLHRAHETHPQAKNSMTW